ncbi:MAG: hypothetical protein PHT54_00100 [Candidatus Nanoarchaeia archaeon]|nr:hypothetical protein [Candidatus Nanoarchaeia archaeon]
MDKKKDQGEERVMIEKEEVRKILEKYDKRLRSSIDLEATTLPDNQAFSKEYEIFKEEALDKTSTFYERACKKAGKIINVAPKEAERKKLEESIETAHLDVTPAEAYSFGVIAGMIIIVLALIVAIFPFIFNMVIAGGADTAKLKIFFPFILMIAGAFIIKPVSNLPHYLANRWRTEAGNQMVLCILYIVMYMRHTSNIEHAIKFAGQHVGYPLSLDLRKVFWNVESGKYSTMKESLESYLSGWKDYNLEFVESFHLIESSLYESSEQRRLELLDKSLEVMLEGSYNRMLNYAHNLQSPITMLHMLGIILPLLGLVVFPLIAAFLQGALKWYHLMILYNILLPVIVFFVGTNLLSKRPVGQANTDILKQNPSLKQFQKLNIGREDKPIYVNPKHIAIFIISIFVLLGFLPLILHYANPSLDTLTVGSGAFSFSVLDYKCTTVGSVRTCVGPYGLGALLLSLLIPLGIAIGLAFYFRTITKRLMIIKKETETLEQEFSGSLFQLGNAVEDGVPAELAFEKVAGNLAGTRTGDFFKLVGLNIRKLGMGIQDAIFDKQRGAILRYPSGLIESSMKVLIEGSRKGPKIVAKSLISISDYVDRIEKVNRRLKDLLADIISSMKSQITFLTPVIAGIVVGVATMVTTIINKLSGTLAGSGADASQQMGGLAGMADILDITNVIPGFYFQLVVGLFVVEMVYILTVLGNSIEKGVDKLSEQNAMGRNMLIGVGLYVLISLIGIIVFTILAGGINVVATT